MRNVSTSKSTSNGFGIRRNIRGGLGARGRSFYVQVESNAVGAVIVRSCSEGGMWYETYPRGRVIEVVP